MGQGQKRLPLGREEDALLKLLYEEWRIPTDQFARRPTDLEAFAKNWNNLAERTDSSAEVLHYMVTKRKKNQWVRLGDNHQVLCDQQHAMLTADEFVAMDEIYENLQVSSDKLVMDEALCAKFAAQFARQTGKIVPAILLAATMVTRRKNGELTTLRPKRDREHDLAFRDIDEIDQGQRSAQ